MDAGENGSQNTVAIELQERSSGEVRVGLVGRLDVETVGAWWHELEQRLTPLRVRSLEVDASQLQIEGGIGIALLRYLKDGGITPDATVTVSGLNASLQKLLDLFSGEGFQADQISRLKKPSIPAEVGAGVCGIVQDLREQITFLGAVARALPVALVRPKRMRWSEVKEVLETAGANALPVVAAFSWLVGIVLALEAAHPLAKLGAQIFIADMIGFASIRDTGPLVTAILLAGRSGSAFAAELGTMKVNEELDALKTMGLEPIRFLVIQRVIGAMILSPLLALYAMGMGMLGGVTVLRFLGFPPRMIFHQIINRVQAGDLMVGLSKSVIFGLIVGGVGCLRGLQTKEGARGVGISTTRSVVACILLIILANTVFSTADYFLSSRS